MSGIVRTPEKKDSKRGGPETPVGFGLDNLQIESFRDPKNTVAFSFTVAEEKPFELF